MPDEAPSASTAVAAPPSAAVAPPVPVEPVDRPVTQSELNRAFQTLQGHNDQLRHAMGMTRAEIARLTVDRDDALAALNQLRLTQQAPDATLNPDQAADYWRKVNEQRDQNASEQRRQYLEAQQREVQAEADPSRSYTMNRINAELEQVYERTGVRITPDDPRLAPGLRRAQDFETGMANFKQVLAGVEKEVSERSKEREAKIRAEARAEAMKELGVDRYDGGTVGGGVTRTRFTRQEIGRMSPSEYEQHRTAILAAYSAGTLDGRQAG